MYVYIYIYICISIHGLPKGVFAECALFQFWAKPDSYYSSNMFV